MDEDIIGDPDDFPEVIESVSNGLDDLDMDLDTDSDSGSSIEYDNDDEQFDEIFHFKENQESIYCCDISKSGNLIAFGTGRDSFFVYDNSKKEIIIESNDKFNDSVTNVCFSSDSLLCAAADMNGNVEVWNLNDNSYQFHKESEEQSFLFWHNTENILIEGTTSGNIYIWHLKTANEKVLPSFGVGSSCAAFLKNNRDLLVAYSNGVLKLWNVRNENTICQLKTRIPDIYEFCLNSDCNLALVYGENKSACLLSIALDNTMKDIGYLEQTDDCDSVEAAVFIESGSLQLVVTGDSNGCVVVWDVPNQKLRHVLQLSNGITIMRLLIDNVIIVGTNDGYLCLIDCKRGQLINSFRYCKKAVLDIKVQPVFKLVAACFDNGVIKLFNWKESLLLK